MSNRARRDYHAVQRPQGHPRRAPRAQTTVTEARDVRARPRARLFGGTPRRCSGGLAAGRGAVYRLVMPNETLVQAVKTIVALARGGDLDAAYRGYRDLFQKPEFLKQRPEDQRQVLRLMILAKGVPSTPTEAMIDAHRAAVPALTELVSIHGDPGDHELLGLCHVVLGNVESADKIFRAGLKVERERNPQSDLCGTLMKRISLL